MLIDLPILLGLEPAPDTLEMNEFDTSPALADLHERIVVIEFTVPAKAALSKLLSFHLSLFFGLLLFNFFLFLFFHLPYSTQLLILEDLYRFSWLACTWIRHVAWSQLFPFQLLFFLKFLSAELVLDSVLLLESCPAFVAAEATWGVARAGDI